MTKSSNQSFKKETVKRQLGILERTLEKLCHNVL